MRRKGHRRQYLGDGRITHYDLLKWQQHAVKLAQYRSAQAVRLVHMAKTLPGGEQLAVVSNALRDYAKSLGLFRGLALRIEVRAARILRWLTAKEQKPVQLTKLASAA